MKIRILLYACILSSISLEAQNWFDPSSIIKHISVLASDSLRGRGTGTPDELKAADYVIAQWKKIYPHY